MGFNLGFKGLTVFEGNALLHATGIRNSMSQTMGARGSAVGWGTALQTRRSRVQFPMVSLDFSIDIILPAAIWPWGQLSLLTEMSTGNVSWGVKAAGAYGWQPYHLQVPTVLKSGSLSLLEPSGPVQACNGITLLYVTDYKPRKIINGFKLQKVTEIRGARGSKVGWSTALQVGRLRVRFPMVSLKFFIDLLLPAALWPWGWLSL